MLAEGNRLHPKGVRQRSGLHFFHQEVTSDDFGRQPACYLSLGESQNGFRCRDGASASARLMFGIDMFGTSQRADKVLFIPYRSRTSNQMPGRIWNVRRW